MAWRDGTEAGRGRVQGYAPGGGRRSGVGSGGGRDEARRAEQLRGGRRRRGGRGGLRRRRARVGRRGAAQDGRGEVRVARAALDGAARAGRDLLVAREADVARERRDAAAEEPAARDLVVGRLDERAVQQQLVLGQVPRERVLQRGRVHPARRRRRRAGARAADARDVGARARGGVLLREVVRVRAPEAEAGREAREGLHRHVEESVQVAARGAAVVHVRVVAVHRARVAECRAGFVTGASGWTRGTRVGAAVRAGGMPAAVSTVCDRLRWGLLDGGSMHWSGCLGGCLGVIAQAQEQFRADPVQLLIRRVLGQLSPRVFRAVMVGEHLERRRGIHARVFPLGLPTNHGADPLNNPGVRDTHGSDRHVRIRDPIADVRGIAWELGVFFLLVVVAVRTDSLTAFYVSCAKEKAASGKCVLVRLVV